MARVAGVDVSRWQGRVDWQQVAAAGYRFAFIRATIGTDYLDPYFAVNWKGARDADILVSAYHVLVPHHSAEAQVAHFFKVLNNRTPDLPLALDVERDDGMGPHAIAQCVRTSLREIEIRDDRKPVIYTARWWWNRFMWPSSEWRAYDLWVASYTPKPLLPRDWASWRFWQYSSRGGVPGIGAKRADVNWFFGGDEELLQYAGREQQKPWSGVKAQITVPKLNVRSGPGKHYHDLGDLHAGDIIEVLRISGKDVWIEFEPGKWAAFSLDGEVFMEWECE